MAKQGWGLEPDIALVQPLLGTSCVYSGSQRIVLDDSSDASKTKPAGQAQ